MRSVYPNFISSFYSHLLFEGSVVYSTQNALYVIYWLYVVYLYPYIAASKQPRGSLRQASIPVLLSRAKAFTIFYLCLINILMILDRQNQSLHCNAEKRFSIYATRNMERVGEKHKGCKLQRKALHAQIC